MSLALRNSSALDRLGRAPPPRRVPLFRIQFDGADGLNACRLIQGKVLADEIDLAVAVGLDKNVEEARQRRFHVGGCWVED